MRKILLTILSFTLIFSLVGCGPKPDESIKSFFESTKSCDFETMSKYIKSDTDSSIITGKFESTEQEDLIKSLFKKIDYEILSTTVNKDEATTKVKITSVDMLRVYSDSMKQVMAILLPQAFSSNKPSDDEIQKMTFQYITNGINDPDVAKTTTEVDLKLTKEKDKWVIESSDELTNAITGNLSKVANK
ncbi:DUF5105 domain-containing protein [Clostridium gasigenes]|uniref:DUF5105 domain-containing protein n=1 Tax=Clostridium gasigenes TaxID=94869 RepID=UPI001C0E71FF|nr:DUF5105 domain-containing protein [Clostridium gasigenes]MBU3105023.1 DUF5105 domain-containing protein [Clostridium gasigenes]